MGTLLILDISVILANIFNREHYKIERCTVDYIERLCVYLDNVMGGYKIFDVSYSNLKKHINENPRNYDLQGDTIICKSTPNKEIYNRRYSPEVAKKLQWSAYIFSTKQ